MKFVLLTLTAALVFFSPAAATTVEPVTFEELVKSAERIFLGEVVAVESFRADLGRGPRIRTRVTFSIDEALRGRGTLAVLEFLGGTVGGVTLDIPGMPRFIAGERYVVFTREGDRWVNPVVGFSQGLFRVSRDLRDGTFRVLTVNRTPLVNAAAIGRPETRVSATTSLPTSLVAFVDEIRVELARQAR